MAAATKSSIFAASTQHLPTIPSIFGSKASPPVSNTLASSFRGSSLARCPSIRKKVVKGNAKVSAAATTFAPTPVEEPKEFSLPSWAMFELGRAPVYWKTMNGLPPTAGEKLRIFYNPAANKIVPNEDYGIAFNGGFNQPIMCGAEPRAMLSISRGKADSPMYSIQICIPRHALNLIFSFTNGVDWDGPYRLQFQVPNGLKNKPIEFFNEGLAEELSKDGACERAIFPDTFVVVTRCNIIGNLTVEGGDRCNLNLVPGCTDPSSASYDPLANVDDGSCPIELE
ncbi:unnamed protein product [Malus baccata var. baccata]